VDNELEMIRKEVAVIITASSVTDGGKPRKAS
jgi:hypothetical protein